MAKLLIQNRSININAQSKQPVYKEEQKKDSQGRMVFQYRGREMVCQSGNQYIYCDDDDNNLVKNDDGSTIKFTTDLRLFRDQEYVFLIEGYDGVKESVRTSEIQRNTALHIACRALAKGIVKILLTRPDVETNIRNCDNKSPLDCIATRFKGIIQSEFEKAQTGDNY